MPDASFTVVELIAEAIQRASDQRQRTTDPAAARDFSLAITYLEDGRSRYTAGRARQLGTYRPADLDRLPGNKTAAQYIAERDQASADAYAKEANYDA